MERTKLPLLNIAMIACAVGAVSGGASYQNTIDIFKDKLGSDNYNTEVRPLKDQSDVMWVQVRFQIVAIVKVDEIAQSFICNGFVYFVWKDEILAWNPFAYGGQFMIHPLPQDIWRPRVVLLNTLAERDIFGDDKAPVFIFYDGSVNWVPGSLFPSSCELDMINYPFDQQVCSIQLSSMSASTQEMLFTSPDGAKVGTEYFNTNGEWELVDTSTVISNLSTSGTYLSAVKFTFVLRRRPYFLLFNIVLPVVFLSFLNILVFAIPVESGEKIAYGITVLLALSVFMSIISGMLPRSSTLPRVTIYLFILLAISVLTVIDSIIIVYIYHKEEKEEISLKAKQRFHSGFTKIRHNHRAVAPSESISKTTDRSLQRQISVVSTSSQESAPPAYESPREDKGKGSDIRVNKYKLIGKYIDLVSFVVFFIVWLTVTVVFMIHIAVVK